MAKKKDDEYWIIRRTEMMYEQMERAEDAAEAIRSQYYKVAKYIDKKLNDSFDKIVNRLGVSDKDIINIIEKAGSTSYQDILRAAKNKGLTELVDYLEQPGRKYRYERLIKQLDETNNAIDSLKATGETETTKALKDIAESTYYKSIYEIQSHVGLAFSFTEWDSKLFEKLALGKWSGKNYSKRIWDNTDALAETLKSELIQGFIAGKTQREMAKVIMDQFSAGAFEAKRLVRTEGNFIANEMNMQAYEECGIEKYMFLATLDLRTSTLCASLDGKIFNVKDGVPGVNMPPMHPFCRSTTIEALDEETLKRMQRRARNPVTGKNELLPAGTTYKEWYAKYVEGNGLEKHGKSSKIKSVNAPEIRSKKIRAAKEEFANALANSNGIEAHVSRMGLYEANTEYKLNKKSDAAFRYDAAADVIEYNPNASYYDEYDMNYVQAHELSHRMDIIEYNSYNNPKFVEAIEICKKKVLENATEIESWFAEGGKYRDAFAISDIISALSDNVIDVPVGHDSKYWSDLENVSLEIFANVSAIDVLDSAEKVEFNSLLKEIYDVYKEMVS